MRDPFLRLSFQRAVFDSIRGQISADGILFTAAEIWNARG